MPDMTRETLIKLTTQAVRICRDAHVPVSSEGPVIAELLRLAVNLHEHGIDLKR